MRKSQSACMRLCKYQFPLTIRTVYFRNTPCINIDICRRKGFYGELFIYEAAFKLKTNSNL